MDNKSSAKETNPKAKSVSAKEILPPPKPSHSIRNLLLVLLVLAFVAIIAGFFIPATVKIELEAVPDDGYARFHGLAADEELKGGFWTVQEDKIFKTSGSWVLYTKDVNLTSSTQHRITYGNSADAGYKWDSTLKINGKVFSGKVDRRNFLVAEFYTWYGIVL